MYVHAQYSSENARDIGQAQQMFPTLGVPEATTSAVNQISQDASWDLESSGSGRFGTRLRRGVDPVPTVTPARHMSLEWRKGEGE